MAEARRFALVWMCASALGGGMLMWRHHPLAARTVWAASGISGFLGVFVPFMARHFYRGWMTLAWAINFAITRLLMVIIFMGVITPMAFLLKLFSRDALRISRKSSAQQSHWIDHDRFLNADYYKHLY